MHAGKLTLDNSKMAQGKVKTERSPKATSGVAKLSTSLIDAKPFIRDILNVSRSIVVGFKMLMSF